MESKQKKDVFSFESSSDSSQTEEFVTQPTKLQMELDRIDQNEDAKVLDEDSTSFNTQISSPINLPATSTSPAKVVDPDTEKVGPTPEKVVLPKISPSDEILFEAIHSTLNSPKTLHTPKKVNFPPDVRLPLQPRTPETPRSKNFTIATTPKTNKLNSIYYEKIAKANAARQLNDENAENYQTTLPLPPSLKLYLLQFN